MFEKGFITKRIYWGVSMFNMASCRVIQDSEWLTSGLLRCMVCLRTW